MEQTWRWFGPEDVIRLPHVRQAGATGIVTALHHIPYGTVWSVEEIEKRNAMITADPSLGLRWRVVESHPVSEPIKSGDGNIEPLFDNYRTSLRNLAACEQLFSKHLDGHRLMSNASHLVGSAAWLNFRRIKCDQWSNGNVILLGDAAHTAHFSIGSGT